MKIFKNFYKTCLLSLYLFAISGCSLSLRTFPDDGDDNKDETTTLISYDIVSNPTKTDYLVDEYFDPSGLSVMLNWDNGKKETITGNDIAFPDSPLKLKDKEITGTYKKEEISVAINVIGIDGYYINIGDTSTSIKSFNEQYTNQKTYVSYLNNKETLVMNLNGDTTINDIPGVFNFLNYTDVIITGNGVFSLAFINAKDGINANNITIDEGAVVNLNGCGKESGIKVFENLNIKGTLNISNFAYAQAIAKKDDGSGASVYVRVFSKGKYNITNCNDGIYAWSSVKYTPTLHVSGELNVSINTSCVRFENNINGIIIFDENSIVNLVSSSGRSIWNTSGSIYIRDNSNVTLKSEIAAITGIDRFVVGNKEDGSTKNNASIKIESNSGNIIETYNADSARNNIIVFNSTGEIHLKSNNSEKSAIMLSNRGDSESLFYVDCNNMVVENVKYFIDASRAQLTSSFKVTYNYSQSNKITLKNSLNILNLTNETLSNVFGPVFNSDTINIINE